jgi:hypothetical protein
LNRQNFDKSLNRLWILKIPTDEIGLVGREKMGKSSNKEGSNKMKGEEVMQWKKEKR